MYNFLDISLNIVKIYDTFLSFVLLIGQGRPAYNILGKEKIISKYK